MPSPHPPEFRRRAVELARQGDKSLVQLAKDLGISRFGLPGHPAQQPDVLGHRVGAKTALNSIRSITVH